jgi:hypothetical protein
MSIEEQLKVWYMVGMVSFSIQYIAQKRWQAAGGRRQAAAWSLNAWVHACILPLPSAAASSFFLLPSSFFNLL